MKAHSSLIQETLACSMNKWLYDYKKNSVKTATFERLVISYRSMLAYPIANTRLMDLTTRDVQMYINKMLDDEYSYSTIKKQFNLISAFIRFLLGEGVPVLPVHLNVIMPSQDKVPSKRDTDAYNKRDQEKLLCAMDDSQGSTAMLLMLETGMRIGEVFALRWGDILWQRRAIRIHSTLVHPQGQAKSYVQEGAKSRSSNRTIPLSTRAYTLLDGIYGGQDGLVFPSTRDPDVSVGYNAIRKQIQGLCNEAGVKYRGMHVFRHTFATNCYYKGCDIKILSKLLGHASVTVTYNTYINLYGDALEEMRSVVG